VRQSIPAFAPLVEHIFQKEGMPITDIETIAPGMNAVFKVGGYVAKIFMPLEVFNDGDFGTNVDVEVFGMKLANAHGVSAPKLIVYGTVDDKYSFRYMIMEYIQGKMLDEIEDNLSYEDKVIIGKNIRKITDKLNISCENFTPIDVIKNAKNNIYWLEDGFPQSFEKERLEYLANFHIDESEKVYCHGDFHCQNILIDENLNVYLIDFADAMYAPVEYELVYIVSSLFCFEKPYMTGYFNDYDVEDIVDLCMTWLPVHAHGHATTQGNFEAFNKITSFAVLRERLRELIKTEKERVYE
jgi:serine/threonine protein kinase